MHLVLTMLASLEMEQQLQQHHQYSSTLEQCPERQFLLLQQEYRTACFWIRVDLCMFDFFFNFVSMLLVNSQENRFLKNTVKRVQLCWTIRRFHNYRKTFACASCYNWSLEWQNYCSHCSFMV